MPLLPDLLAAIAEIAARHDVEIPVVAHAGDGNTHPIIVYDAADPDSERRARAAFDEVMAAGDRASAAPSPASTASGAPRRRRCPTSSAPT